MTNPLRLALVGLGNQGQEHLQAATQSTSVRFVVGIDPSAEMRQRTTDPNLRLLSDLHELQPNEVDALVLAVPHHCYASIWEHVLRFGLPILKEKPLGRSYEEAISLLQQAREAGCPVQTAIQRRHHPSYQWLKKTLQERRATIQEIHAHLHLGFSPATGPDASWRGNRQAAGGGALLDAGYHLVDLVHHLVGSFDLISATLWQQGQPIGEQEIDDRAWVVGRSQTCWVMIDSWRSGDIQPDTGRPQKSERVTIQTNQGTWHANREGVWHNNVPLINMPKDWNRAMLEQLERFAHNIRHNDWHQTTIWDQLPAMRLIDEAYRLAARS